MPEPSKALRQAALRRLAAVDELTNAQTYLADLIRAEIAAGVRQVDIVKATGYTREQVRRIVKAGQDG